MCSWIGKLNIVKILSILVKALGKFLKFNAISIKFLVAYFCRNGRKSLKIHIELQILNSQNNLEGKKEKKKQSWKLHCS